MNIWDRPSSRYTLTGTAFLFGVEGELATVFNCRPELRGVWQRELLEISPRTGVYELGRAAKDNMDLDSALSEP